MRRRGWVRRGNAGDRLFKTMTQEHRMVGANAVMELELFLSFSRRVTSQRLRRHSLIHSRFGSEPVFGFLFSLHRQRAGPDDLPWLSHKSRMGHAADGAATSATTRAQRERRSYLARSQATTATTSPCCTMRLADHIGRNRSMGSSAKDHTGDGHIVQSKRRPWTTMSTIGSRTCSARAS